MKIFRLLLIAGTALGLAPVPAHAGIETLIIGIHGFLLTSTAISATVAGTLATVIGYGIAGAAVVGAAVFGRPKQGGAVKPSDAKSTFETGESSVIEGVGRVRVGGLQVFGNTDGSTRARVIARLQGPIDGVEEYYLGGREVTVESSGDVISPPWARPGGSWATWKDKIGDGSETAWPDLIDMFPTLWTSAHRVRGIAQSMLLFFNPGLEKSKYMSLYQGGAPNSEEVVRASLIYDPRTGLTAWSENAIVILAHVLRRDPAFGSDRFDWDLIGTWADAADVMVDTKTGTEKRSRLWGMWAWESERGETMQQFLDSAGAEIRLTAAGKIYFELVSDTATAEIDFTPADIYDFTWMAGPEAVSRPNICRIKYYSPERNYEMTEINLDGIEWALVQDEIYRYGPKYFDLDLPFCPSAAQAQRIGRLRFALERGDRGALVTNMVGLAAWGLLYADVEDPDLGDVELVKMSPPRIDDDNGSVEIPFVVWPMLTEWDPETDEADAPEPVPELSYVSDIETPDAPGAVIQITYPDATKEFRIGYAQPAAFDIIEANYRTYTGGLPNAWQGMSELAGAAYDGADLLGETVDARLRVFIDDEGSIFSPLFNAVVGINNTANTAPIQGSLTVEDGAVGAIPATLSTSVSSQELHIAALTFERRINGGGYVTVETRNARPFTQYVFTDSYLGPTDDTVSWRITPLTSNGTAGTSVSYSAIIN